VEQYFNSPNTISWRGAQLKKHSEEDTGIPFKVEKLHYFH
jgi:hypothetical protein